MRQWSHLNEPEPCPRTILHGLSNGFKKAYQSSVHSLDKDEAAKHWWRRNDESKVSGSLGPGELLTCHTTPYTWKPRASKNTSSSSILTLTFLILRDSHNFYFYYCKIMTVETTNPAQDNLVGPAH